MTTASVTALDTFQHEPDAVDSAVIWLHGLGADGHDFEPLMPVLGLARTRFIFPNAPVRPVTINGGMQMRAWYDFLSLDFSNGEEPAHIEASIQSIQALMDEQLLRGIDPQRMVLAGFSQGGAIALLAALTYPRPVAAVLALSTYIPQAFMRNAWPQQPAVLQCHGSSDPVIPYAVAKASYQALETAGIPVQFETYPMAHQVCDDEIVAIKQFLHKAL